MKVFLDANDKVVTIPTDDANIDLAWIQANREELNATQQIDNCPAELLRYETLIINIANANAQYHVKTSGDGTDISHYTLTDDLRKAKLMAENKVDKNTYRILRGPYALGFQFNGHYFSMSHWGQINLIGGTMAAGSLTFPLEWTVHDLEGIHTSYSIADATELNNIFGTGLGRKKVILESGRTIKDAIEAAVDQAGIDAALATDTRDYGDYP
jgi:hypothetical protein